MRGQTLELPRQPGPVPPREVPSRRERAAARNRHPRRAIRTQSKHIASGAWVVNQRQGNTPTLDLHEFPDRHEPGRIQDEL